MAASKRKARSGAAGVSKRLPSAGNKSPRKQPDRGTSALEFHPLADIFPLLDGEAFAELKRLPADLNRWAS
jgi:hypothetical protein